jgi:hypothetical protein
MPPYTAEPSSSQGQAVPKAFNLGLEKPVTVPAYGRQVQSIATNAQSFGPNTIANIVIDTSTPGAFLDPHQSLIQFDVTFTNTNPHIDFLNFGAAGAASLIQELRIYNQGTPIVEILDYNLAFETWMKLNNFQQQEFKLYMENSWRAPVANNESDLNFVKPPMVDLNGIIMWPTTVNQFGDGNTTSKKSIGHYLSYANAVGGDNYPNIGGVNYDSNGDTENWLAGGYAKRPRPGILPAGTLDAGATVNLLAHDGPFNYAHNYNPTDINSSYTDAPGTINSMTWTNRIDDTYVTWPDTIRPEKKGTNLGIQMQENAIKNYRLEDYLMYLSNVKNIPVGIKPSKSFIKTDKALERPTATAGNETDLANWNLGVDATTAVQSNAASNTDLAGSCSYTIGLPFFDGLLGMGAEKQFPAMLIAPSSLYIQIRFAKIEQAVQVTMDPCRRIFGTYRDYVPNVGLPSYYATEYYGQLLSLNRTDLGSQNTSANPTTWMAYTSHAARGTDFAWSGILPLYPPKTATTSYSAGPPAVYPATTANNGNAYRNNIFWNNYSGVGAFDTAAMGLPNTQFCPNGQGFNEGLCTGLPKPQYVPVATPWIYSGNLFHKNAPGTKPTYVNETNVCYGTYLPRSTAQVRRTNVNSYPGNMTSPNNINAVPTYTINNLRYTGYQTVLSDEITAAIVRSAAKEDVSIQGQTWKTYRTICSASSAQTIILPAKIASANSIHCIFQNQTMYENLNYNSLTGNCPLVKFQWQVDTNHFVGSDTAPILTGVATTGTPFSIQLRIGNELLPVQPITSIPQLVSELEKSLHCKGDFSHSIQAQAITNGSSTYGSLNNYDFLAPFVPIAALDDQTITDNPAFMDYLGQSYATFRQRGNYGTGLFKPPESNFMLGWDTDTFYGNNDNARSGRYLGNAPITIHISGANGIGTSSLSTSSSSDAWSCIAIILCDIRFSIGAGGSITAYY